MTEGRPEDRMPRGVLVIVAVGLLASVLAAVLSTDKGSGEAADLVWMQSKPMPNSATVSVPGGGGTMQLTGSGIRATGSNRGGHSLYRVISVLNISAGAPVGSGRIECEMRAPEGTEIAQTPKYRAAYPRPTPTDEEEYLREQEVPEVFLIEFSALGAELATVTAGDLPERFATESGIKLEWSEHQNRRNGWKWILPPGKPREPLVLPFAAVWNTTVIPSAKVGCTLETSAGEATVRTSGALPEAPELLIEEEEEEEEGEEQQEEG